MDSLNVKNINDEKIFNVIDPNGQGEVVNRIRPISVSISQKVETINDETVSNVTLSVYWNDTWKSILELSFDDSLRQEYGKLVTDLTAIQKDIDMKQYKDAETKTNDFLKYVGNLSSKYTNIPTTQNVAASKNDFVSITANKNSFNVKISDKLLNFMLGKFEKVASMDYTKANECFSVKGNDIDIFFHSPELFKTQAYITVVKDKKVVGSYKATYDQFSKLASKLTLTPQQLGYTKDKMAGYIKTAEVVMQNIFFDSVDEAKEWQEMVDEKKKEEIEPAQEGQEESVEETTTTTTTEEKSETESPVKGDGGLARPSEDFASDEIPESEPRQQEQQQGGQMAASRRLNLLRKEAVFPKYQVEPLPQKTPQFEKGNMVETPMGKGEILDILKARLSNTPYYKIKLENGKEVEILEEELTKIALRKQAIEGDVQEQDIVPAKTETKVYLQSEKSEDFAWLLDGNGSIEILAPKDLILGATGSGDNSNGVNELRDYIKKDLEKIPTEKIQKIVSGYGIENVKEMDRDELERYLVWLLAGDTADDLENRLADKDELKNIKAKTTNKMKKSATDYKGEVAELLDEINEPDVLVDYISEDDAKKICKELNIPHEAEWYKGDLRGYIDEIPDGMVDVLIEYISESDAEQIWRQIQHDSGKYASKKINVKKNSSDKWLEKDTEEYMKKDIEGTKAYLEKYLKEKPELFKKQYGVETVEEAIELLKEKNPSWYKKAEETVEEKIEEQVGEDGDVKGVIGVGDIVCIKFDNLSEGDFAKYSEFLGVPMLLIENDKEDISKVIIEQVEYPFQRVTINKDNIGLFDNVKDEQVIVEDVDGDEMITDFVELPVVAKQCKIKSIHKAANISKKKAEMKKKADNYWDRHHPVIEEEFEFYRDELLIDDEWKKCSGKVYVVINAELEYGTLPDGETSTGETYLSIDKYKVLELMELEIDDEPNRKFTTEELAKILEDNRETIEDADEMPSLVENMENKINEPAENPYE